VSQQFKVHNKSCTQNNIWCTSYIFSTSGVQTFVSKSNQFIERTFVVSVESTATTVRIGLQRTQASSTPTESVTATSTERPGIHDLNCHYRYCIET